MDVDLRKFPLIPYKTPTQAGIAPGIGILRNFFLSPLHGIILAIFENAKMGKKTGNLFLISCLGVPFYVAAVIQFFGMAVHQSGT